MCGIVGVVSNQNVNQAIFDALTVLQHRGQDAAGMLTCDGKQMALRKGRGLVVDAIRTRHMLRLKGSLGIGHVRYPTQGSDSEAESQPFYVNSPYGIALAHNGNLTNSEALTETLSLIDNRHINTTSDSEVLLNVIAAELSKLNVSITEFNANHFFSAMENILKRAQGGYAVCGVIAGAGLFAFRDPNGIRPLIIGQKENNNQNEIMIASESVALDCDGYELLGDVEPGEAIFVDLKGNIHRKICSDSAKLTPCIFEYVYLARPDSVIDGASVYHTRLRMGEKVAQKLLKLMPEHDIDVVIPVPDSGRHAALSIADTLNLPYREGFVKNRYVGRTFIMPGQGERTKSIRKKLNTMACEFEGRHVLLVDDSIVRGNTSKKIIEMARKAGARKVSIISAAPPIRYPNVYGIDMPTHKELIAFDKKDEDIAGLIGADCVIYQDLDDLIASVKEESKSLDQFETSVFDGKYITGDINQDYFDQLKALRDESHRSAGHSLLDIHNEN
ncbi:amidophosphoribosyltransferase [Thiotrichales bacterium 19S11-10]|nr:amidophosphoribosyltransferase [Thiotrichales bacterium 19S11-10]MCF6807466.1 amidophosphoribosyltransferase [Thiotrichales bacterium 19S9-11]MCF6811435.1 amidophosphoribosyltransferase [Thiotrichales bacterium 19S9-12]